MDSKSKIQPFQWRPCFLPEQERETFSATAKCGWKPYSADCTEDSSLLAEWSWMEVSRDLGKCLLKWKTLIRIFTQPNSAIWLGQINCAETLLFCRQETKTHRSNYLTGPNKSQTVRENNCKTAFTSWYKFLQGIPRVGTELLENHFITPYLFFSWFSYPQT